MQQVGKFKCSKRFAVKDSHFFITKSYRTEDKAHLFQCRASTSSGTEKGKTVYNWNFHSASQRAGMVRSLHLDGDE
jgi:hypothetical protein